MATRGVLSQDFTTMQSYDVTTDLPNGPVIAWLPDTSKNDTKGGNSEASKGHGEKGRKKKGNAKRRKNTTFDPVEGLKILQNNASKGVYSTCSTILFTETVDFHTADTKCKELKQGGSSYGNLVTVNNDIKTEEIKFLLELAHHTGEDINDLDQWVWVGLKKVENNKGNKASQKYDANHWKWPDGSSPSVYSNWQPGQPDQKKKWKWKQNQIRINSKGEWQDTWPNSVNPYICDYDGKYIISGIPLRWRSARNACIAAGMTLARVRDLEEVDEMKEAIRYFLGPETDDGDVFSDMNWVLLGGNDIGVEGRWKWADGIDDVEDVEEFPWINKAPDNSRKKHKPRGKDWEDVMSMSKWGQFDDTFTLTTQRAFACQCLSTL